MSSVRLMNRISFRRFCDWRGEGCGGVRKDTDERKPIVN